MNFLLYKQVDHVSYIPNKGWRDRADMNSFALLADSGEGGLRDFTYCFKPFSATCLKDAWRGLQGLVTVTILVHKPVLYGY